MYLSIIHRQHATGPGGKQCHYPNISESIYGRKRKRKRETLEGRSLGCTTVSSAADSVGGGGGTSFRRRITAAAAAEEQSFFKLPNKSEKKKEEEEKTADVGRWSDQACEMAAAFDKGDH
ncbi:hypothetical protein TYRP_013370 [Tyrophagus putrescentiae]|nr:hypothetical protein TYRP_013370 [Tyrophagus putrescentiae]